MTSNKRIRVPNILVMIFMITSFILGAQEKPNIVIIMADDLGYGGISCYENTSINTPNIDALASNGVKFTDFHSNGSVCSPTRAALMTGKYQQRTGVRGVITAKKHRHVGLSLDEVTLAEELKKIDYNCGMFGKWHLGYDKTFNPIQQGFDRFVGFVSGNIDYHGHIDQEGYLDWWKGNKIENERGYSTDLITDYGVEYIKDKNPDKTGKPFFLYLPHEAPHGPYQKRIDDILREEGKAKTKHVDGKSIASIYKEMVEVMDEGVGKIIKTLKETNQYENTIVIFLSDNGANKHGNNGGLRGFKAGVYEGGSRVPAIFSYPNIIKNGTTNKNVALSMDILPTVLDFLGENPTERIDGISLKETLINQTQLPARDSFYDFGGQRFIRHGDWKLVRIKRDNEISLELYNLSNDLEEQKDVSLTNVDLVQQLEKKLNRWYMNVNKGVTSVSGQENN